MGKIKEKIPSDYQVVPFGEDRFAIATSGGEIIDDAQGWGYKTKVSAHKAAAYKMNHKNIDGDNQKVVKFMRDNKPFREDVEAALFYAMKDGEEMTVEDVEAIVKERKLTLPLPVDKFFKVMMRKSCKW